jgi:hypothetical protein
MQSEKYIYHFLLVQVGQGVDSILVCMVLVVEKIKNLKKKPSLICESKRTISNYFFYVALYALFWTSRSRQT